MLSTQDTARLYRLGAVWCCLMHKWLRENHMLSEAVAFGYFAIDYGEMLNQYLSAHAH